MSPGADSNDKAKTSFENLNGVPNEFQLENLDPLSLKANGKGRFYSNAKEMCVRAVVSFFVY